MHIHIQYCVFCVQDVTSMQRKKLFPFLFLLVIDLLGGFEIGNFMLFYESQFLHKFFAGDIPIVNNSLRHQSIVSNTFHHVLHEQSSKSSLSARFSDVEMSERAVRILHTPGYRFIWCGVVHRENPSTVVEFDHVLKHRRFGLYVVRVHP